MNENWKFYRGCIANAEQTSSKTLNGELDLPHDWSMDPVPIQREGITIGPFSRMSVGGADTGQTIEVKDGIEKNSPYSRKMPIKDYFPLF